MQKMENLRHESQNRHQSQNFCIYYQTEQQNVFKMYSFIYFFMNSWSFVEALPIKWTARNQCGGLLFLASQIKITSLFLQMFCLIFQQLI